MLNTESAQPGSARADLVLVPRVAIAKAIETLEADGDEHGVALNLVAMLATSAEQHSDDAAVDAFAVAMKEKLAAARAKGRGGWEDKEECSQLVLSHMLRGHVEKGDPRDVANLCCFLWSRGEGILAGPMVNEPFGSPEQLTLNEPSGDSGQLASLEQRARELLKAQYLRSGMADATAETLTAHVERTQPEALRAITAALSAQPRAMVVPGNIALGETIYTPPGEEVRFCYTRGQPDNMNAWRLGEACRQAADASAGDHIDRGLALLKALEERGYGVFRFAKCAAPQPREVRGVDAGWIFYFTDDEGTPFVHYCGNRDELEQAVVAHWFQGDDAEADDGQRMAPGIADELARNGVFHAEDGSCFAKPINVSIAGLGVGRVDLRQEKVSVGVTSSSLESVPAPTDGTHEVKPEAIEAGLGLVGGELGLAADANPHSDGSIHLIATTPQDAAGVTRIEPLDVTDAEISEWLERHDLAHAIRGRDARAAFEDAQSFHMTKPATTPPPGVDVAALRQIAGELRDNAHHHHQEDREVGILADEQEAQFNTELAERIERALTGDAAAPGVRP